MSWRGNARLVIQGVIARVGFDDLAALRKAIREAYPFGPRAHHPYKIWLDEVQKATHGRLKPGWTPPPDGPLFDPANLIEPVPERPIPAPGPALFGDAWPA